jgi:hypothetical protein
MPCQADGSAGTANGLRCDICMVVGVSGTTPVGPCEVSGQDGGTAAYYCVNSCGDCP